MTAALLSPRARRDLLSAVRWIAGENLQAARGMRVAIAQAAQRIGKHPLSGVSRPDIAGEPFRFLPLTAYPYIVVYDAERQPPLILRILHGARDLPTILKHL